MARAPNPELRTQSNAQLLEVATSKNYGKSTREGARQILDERGVKISDRDFANPNRGNVPEPPPGTGNRAVTALLRVVLGLLLIGVAAYLRMYFRSH